MRILFDSLEIRFKFLLSFSLIFFLSMLFCNLFIYVYVRDNIEARIESELTSTTQLIYNMVDTSVNVSIKNHLRAVAEKNLEIVKSLYEKAKKGVLTEAEAKKWAADMVLSQTIGNSGYLYCLDSAGMVLVHPSPALIGTNVADFEFVEHMTEFRQGYLEYDWKNPEKSKARPKALYMSYFEPWDWIISASAYRSEFIKLVNVEDFRKSILSLNFGETGYAFVIDKDANAFIHPILQGVNIFDTKELPNRHLEDMMQRKKGKSVYYWKNPGESRARQKLVMFNYIPEYQWIVGCSSYLDELYKPLGTIRNVILGMSVLFFGIMLTITFGVSRTITTPLRELTARFNTVTSGDYSARMHSRSTDEVGQLSGHFNRFMDRLETTHNSLQDEIRVRVMAEQARKESQERYFLLMEAAPDPIINYDMKGQVVYINPAFTRVFGWTIEECVGKKMDHFVPENHWAEKIGDLMGDAVEKSRQLARGLCPVHLVAHGLQAALEEIIFSFSYHPDIRFEFHGDKGIDFQDNNRATHLYHIAREAINNAVKHSKGSLVGISLTLENKGKSSEQIHMCVHDNGQGIDDLGSTRGIGLQIMEYRAKLIDAQFYIDSGPEGTRIHVLLNRAVSVTKKEMSS